MSEELKVEGGRLLSIAEAAAALGYSHHTLRLLCKQRKIRHERHGQGRGRIRIPADAIAQYRRAVTVDRVEG